MKFKLEVELGNDAMQSNDDLAIALASVIDRLQNAMALASVIDTEVHGTILDLNGNNVGKFYIDK